MQLDFDQKTYKNELFIWSILILVCSKKMIGFIINGNPLLLVLHLPGKQKPGKVKLNALLHRMV